MIRRVCMVMLAITMVACGGIPMYGIGMVPGMVAGEATHRLTGHLMDSLIPRPPSQVYYQSAPLVQGDNGCFRVGGKEYCEKSMVTAMPKLPPVVLVEKKTEKIIKDEKGCEWTAKDGGTWNCPKKESDR